jgi:hypothetical protein
MQRWIRGINSFTDLCSQFVSSSQAFCLHHTAFCSLCFFIFPRKQQNLFLRMCIFHPKASVLYIYICDTPFHHVVLVGRKANSLPHPLASCHLAGTPRFWLCLSLTNKLGGASLCAAIGVGRATSQIPSKSHSRTRSDKNYLIFTLQVP